MSRKSSSSEAICHNCGYHWMPKPKRWQNSQFVKRKGRELKILRCPACNSQIGIDRKQYRRILVSQKRQ